MIGPLKKRNRLLKIFLSTLYLSAFTFGGGYVIITLMKQKFVDELHWIDDDEMLDMVAIAQSSPGPIAVNGAVIIGYKLEGIAGVFSAVLGAVLPPFVILTVISMFYSAFRNLFVVQSLLTGMKAGVSAVILSVVYDMAAGVIKGKDRKGDKGMIFLQLFFAFLQIGAFSFGGGYAAMPLIQAQVVQKFGWLSAADFSDLVTIAEMTPGPIAINAATFVGNQVAGIAGAVVATVGVILPSCLFVSVLAWLYMKYRKLSLLQGILHSLRPAVVAMIFTAGLGILVSALFRDGMISFAAGNFQIRSAVLVAAAFAALRIWKLNPILVMVACGVAETAAQLLTR